MGGRTGDCIFFLLFFRDCLVIWLDVAGDRIYGVNEV